MTRRVTQAHVDAFAVALLDSYREGNLTLQALKDLAHTIEMFVLAESVRTAPPTPPLTRYAWTRSTLPRE